MKDHPLLPKKPAPLQWRYLDPDFTGIPSWLAEWARQAIPEEREREVKGDLIGLFAIGEKTPRLSFTTLKLSDKPKPRRFYDPENAT